jgi:hypothetical protein
MASTLCLYASRTGSGSGQHAGISPLPVLQQQCLTGGVHRAALHQCQVIDNHRRIHTLSARCWAFKQLTYRQSPLHKPGTCCQPCLHLYMTNAPCCMLTAPINQFAEFCCGAIRCDHQSGGLWQLWRGLPGVCGSIPPP